MNASLVGGPRTPSRTAVVGALLVAILAGCGSPPPTPPASVSASPAATTPTSAETTPPTASPSPSPTSSPTPSAPSITAPGRQWYPVAVGDNGGSDLYGAASMRAVAALTDGFIAVGVGPTGGLDWTSPDGRSWARTEFPSKVLHNAEPRALAVGSDQIVAVGTYVGLNETRRPAMWATAAGPDSLVGGSWTLVFDPAGGTAAASGATNAGMMAGVVFTTDGFVAVGTMGQRGYAWRSPDGTTWSPRIALPDAANVDLWQLVSGRGGILLSGESFGDNGWQALTWISTDGGKTWTDSPFTMGNLDSIAADRNGYWAFGWTPDKDGNDTSPHAVLHSTDGVAWSKVGALPPGTASVATAIPDATGDLLVVVVTPGAATGHVDAGIYSTADPRGPWTKEGPADVRTSNPTDSTALIATDDSIVAVGSASDRPAAWLAVPAGVAAPPAPPRPVTQPAGWCPSGAPDLPTIISLSQRDRLRCFGTRALHFGAFIVQPEGLGGVCGCTATPAWLTGGGLGYAAAWLAPFDAPYGHVNSLPAFARPTVSGTGPSLRWVSVTGHFDDPAASTCRIRNTDGSLRDSVAASVRQCRQNFVITRIVTTAPPDPTSDLRIGKPYAVEPDDGGIDQPPPEVKGFGIADVWRNDAPVATMLVFRTALSAAATRAFTAGQAGDLAGSTVVTIGGVSVILAADGSAAVFTIGHRTFRIVSTVPDGAAPAPGEIRAIARSLIALNH